MSQVAAHEARAGLGLGDQAGVVEVGRGNDPLHRAPLPRMPDQGARVDPLDADHSVFFEVRGQRPGRAMIAGPAAQLTNDEPANPGPPALGIGRH